MNTTITTFELRVRVRGVPYEYYARFAKRISHDVVKMFHVQRRTPEQAVEVGRKYGEVLTCRKVNRDKVLGSAENIRLEPQNIYVPEVQYNSALAMDEMIWKKRNIRRNNIQRDKKDIVD
jgi:hypothetical protein